MLKLSNLKTLAIATIICLGIIFWTASDAASSGIEIEYRSFSGTKTIGLPADEYTANLAQLSERMLGRDRRINFPKIDPRPEIPNDDIILFDSAFI